MELCPAKKEAQLEQRLSLLDRAVLAYSGGVDSAYLLDVAAGVLGERLVAVSVYGDIFSEAAEAPSVLEIKKVKHCQVLVDFLNDPDFVRNDVCRCYYCKRKMFETIRDEGRKILEGKLTLLDGTNKDDLDDYRPGQKATGELGVVSPLVEVGLGKKEIRELSKRRGLLSWNKPSEPCLCSRINYGEKITIEKIVQVRKAEDFLHKLGFIEVRARSYDSNVRIEVLPEVLPALTGDPLRSKVVAYMKELGYCHISVDLIGLQTGSLNEKLAFKRQEDRDER